MLRNFRSNHKLFGLISLMIISGTIVSFLEYNMFIKNLKVIQLEKSLKNKFKIEFELCKSNNNSKNDDNSSKTII